MSGKRILMIVGGGIAAYKTCELIRIFRRADMPVRCVLTEAGAKFVTPMTLGALSEQPVCQSLWDLERESKIGHIALSRDADLVVVAPATADLIAKMAGGQADDLATTLLLATDKQVLIAPAMNVRMWQHPATRRNVAQLRADGVIVMDPDEGMMACGEFGPGRLPTPDAIAEAARRALDASSGTLRGLAGRHVLVTAGPTHEPIDPVRYIANRSSGRQGFAIAAAAAAAGARVTLIAGPVALVTPAGVTRVDVETAVEMAAAVDRALPADVAVMVAAVADWRTETALTKMKKDGSFAAPLPLVENPDILATLAKDSRRPRLLIGFAAETDHVVEHAVAKRVRKQCDWIIANDVSGEVMGGASNRIHLVRADGVEHWDEMPKEAVAERLIERVVDALA